MIEIRDGHKENLERCHELISKLGDRINRYREISQLQYPILVCRYWKLKKAMAPGSEPPEVAALFKILEPVSDGLSLCVAGGGGYAVCVLRPNISISDLKQLMDDRMQDYPLNSMKIELSEVAVENTGLTVDWIDEEDVTRLFSRHTT